MKRVIIESPYAGDVERNLEYGRACLRDSLMRGESPIASHMLYTQSGVLDDDNPTERILGIEAGLAWGEVSDGTVVYNDYGISIGMLYGINRAHALGKPVEFRYLLPQ
jgi:hypothetical protein